MTRPLTHPAVTHHIHILERYFHTQRQLLSHLQETPQDPFEQNSYIITQQQLEQDIDAITEQLNASIVKLAEIPYTAHTPWY